MTQVVPSICRICTAFCPIVVTVEDGRAVKVAGDRDAALFDGYTCPKGRALPEQHNDSRRLLHCLKRDADGAFMPIRSDDAIAEVTAKVQDILERHGPRAVALYFGTGVVPNPTGVGIASAWFRAIKSRMIFSASTIDKPGANIAIALHGNWVAGAQSFDSADTWMIVGANPVISKTSSVPSNNPGQRLKEAVKRGMKLIVVDPRRTETAKRAHIHLQARPGEDPTLLAGMLHIIIGEGLCDSEFMATNARGLETLKATVARYTPEYVAQRAGVFVEDMFEAARTFGRGKRGGVVCATGPSFSTHSNLTFYLAMCLNTVCGRWVRAGDVAPYPNVLLPAYTPKAQPYPPYPATGDFAMRVHGLKENASGMPSAALADEILLEGEGQVKALFCIGGNPLLAWPDQAKAEAAMKKLDLLVVFDYQMSATAAHADYVLASPLSLEAPGATNFMESVRYLGVSRGYETPWAQYSAKVIDPPAGSDLIDDREFFFRMAQRMKLQLDWINFYGYGRHVESPAQTVPFDMRKVPSVDDLLELMCRDSRIPLAEVKRHPHGHHFEELRIPVEPRDPDCTAYLELGDPLMMEELTRIRQENFHALHENAAYPYLLTCRRANDFMNSSGQTLAALNRGKRYNPAFMNPADMQTLGLGEGTTVNLRSANGVIRAIVEGDGSLRPGVVSITHGFGSAGSHDNDPQLSGSPVTRLMGMDERDSITGIPRMSALSIAVERCVESA